MFKNESKDISLNESRANQLFNLTEIYISFESYKIQVQDRFPNANHGDLSEDIKTKMLHARIPYGKYIIDNKYYHGHASYLAEVLVGFINLSAQDDRFQSGLLGGSKQYCEMYRKGLSSYIDHFRPFGRN